MTLVQAEETKICRNSYTRFFYVTFLFLQGFLHPLLNVGQFPIPSMPIGSQLFKISTFLLVAPSAPSLLVAVSIKSTSLLSLPRHIICSMQIDYYLLSPRRILMPMTNENPTTIRGRGSVSKRTFDDASGKIELKQMN